MISSISFVLPQDNISYDIEYYQDFDEILLFIKNEKRNHTIITDSNIFEKSPFFKNIPLEKILVIPAGEQYKNWKTIERLLHHFFQCELDRSSVVFAIGGGVVGDMVGFASSIFMRGIPFIQIPTTVLSMVDSSVGGKTGIDTDFGKNLLGAFHHPEKVMIGKPFLKTLPFEEVQNGLAEMIKHSIISNRFFENLQQFSSDFSKDFSQKKCSQTCLDALFLHIANSILIKKGIVTQDEKEKGVRAWLNLGHTFGHAIENISNYSTPHGLAVAKGIILALEASLKKGILEEKELLNETKTFFSNLSMDVSCSFLDEELLPFMKHDKKKKEGIIQFILPKKKGEMVITCL